MLGCGAPIPVRGIRLANAPSVSKGIVPDVVLRVENAFFNVG
jgi:hypothetical protein